MVRKAFCIPALVSSFIAVVLLILTVVSMPTTLHKTTPFEIVRAYNLNGTHDLSSDSQTQRSLTAVKFGIWGYCAKAQGDSTYKYCTHHLSHNYNGTFGSPSSELLSSIEVAKVTRGYIYTRGLVTATVALGVAFIALVISLVPSLIVELVASFIYLIATLITLAAFIVQVVFYVYLKVEFHKVSRQASVVPGPAFYFTLISIPLLFFSALTVCCGWRKGSKETKSTSFRSDYDTKGLTSNDQIREEQYHSAF